ncbi:BAR domain-containing protein [Fusibacter ferrireducens]|uniref:RNA polymerase subunit sigma-70 n=1 Tax=Fusibacter ferrireducens TaxID=2785058 RepID=A0ABR9ZTV7_9FIRM|nr:hypothetical protein [Fusibacter ferrireducens]MBF4693907.1 hypothetical protein [Fusibacter ferrireducens]
MTTVEIKNMLKSYNTICGEIHHLNQEILELSEVAASHRELSAITYSDMPRGNQISDPTYEKAQKIIDLYTQQVEKIESKIELLFAKKNYVEALLSKLPDIETEIIRLRYFKKYRWEMISNVVSYSRRQCINIHDKILEDLAE